MDKKEPIVPVRDQFRRLIEESEKTSPFNATDALERVIRDNARKAESSQALTTSTQACLDILKVAVEGAGAANVDDDSKRRFLQVWELAMKLRPERDDGSD